MEKELIVTVCMTAYNQARYIKDAIESVLMQKTTFPFQLLIGEDCGGKDNTLEICREYEKKHPHIIQVLHDGKNHGMVANEQRLMDAASGKYISFCEADDYWLDPLKLQKQVDVLDKNPHYSACASQSRIINGADKENWGLLSEYKTDRIIKLSDLINSDGGFQTASFIFRTEYIRNLPALPIQLNGWDRAVFMLNALRGDIYWIKEPLAVYRKNETGNSTWVKASTMAKDIEMVNWFRDIDSNFPVNALRAHIYCSIISNSIVIKTKSILFNYIRFLFYARRSEMNIDLLKMYSNKTLAFRLPKNLRRIFRKIGILHTYAE